MYNLYKIMLILAISLPTTIIMSSYLSIDNGILFCLSYFFLIVVNIAFILIFIQATAIPFKVKSISNSPYFVSVQCDKIVILYNDTFVTVAIRDEYIISDSTTPNDIIEYVNGFKRTQYTVAQEFKHHKF